MKHLTKRRHVVIDIDALATAVERLANAIEWETWVRPVIHDPHAGFLYRGPETQ